MEAIVAILGSVALAVALGAAYAFVSIVLGALGREREECNKECWR